MRTGDTKPNGDSAGPQSYLEHCSNPQLTRNVLSVSAVSNFELPFPHLEMPASQGSYADETEKACNCAQHTERCCRNGGRS